MDPLEYYCTECGSTDIWVNCDATWNVETQQLEILRHFDDCGCDACGAKDCVDVRHQLAA